MKAKDVFTPGRFPTVTFVNELSLHRYLRSW